MPLINEIQSVDNFLGMDYKDIRAAINQVCSEPLDCLTILTGTLLVKLGMQDIQGGSTSQIAENTGGTSGGWIANGS